MSTEDPYVMYLVVRESLNMTSGKLAAQCGHAVQMLLQKYYTQRDNLSTDELLSFSAWLDTNYRKVVLRASDGEFEKIKKELNCVVVIDAGLTQLEPNTPTVLGLLPLRKSLVPKLIKRLQLL